ncbi:hypothetical protein M409DRAFT_67963 [Zasmidium cellare ATCC 36951]|uniref:AB hydrolase-1 domain-containing protein n=1 Tax=Zasmidium cellare ATCC 36951 TaxID=1080233 RepID=A0A6A6CBS3_ZASCE|nr:uncharacterized protein M409DRAFT_67963 [Zasmidium cellare ATCC 36951]KAF2164471.1 hypothetical protein M409DRAFT_67963 [Zasmidium cellare ATCC 36951]
MASTTANRAWRHKFANITSPSQNISLSSATPYQFRIHYVDVPAYNKNPAETAKKPPKGTILLIHGFPQTWLQFRHVIDPLSNAGYRLIVPDYRGAGNSQAPPSNAGFAGGKGGGYTKVVMADDLHTLVRDHLDIKEKIHVFGHDIGAMIAHAYASFFAADTASLIWIDCPLPGSKFHDSVKKAQVCWHFTFHNVEDDLPEKLVEGKERIYMRHFFDRLAVNPWGIPPGGEEEDAYVLAYSRPGAFRAAFDTYRAFEEDGRENLELVRRVGKARVPALAISGDGGFNKVGAREQLEEFYESVDAQTVKDSGHWVVEEAPEEFVEKALAWLGKVSS